MKKAMPILLALLLAACGGKNETAGEAMEGSGMMADSAQSTMPMQGSGAMADSSGMGSGMAADTSGPGHD